MFVRLAPARYIDQGARGVAGVIAHEPDDSPGNLQRAAHRWAKASASACR
jgi:hypothetical protein